MAALAQGLVAVVVVGQVRQEKTQLQTQRVGMGAVVLCQISPE